MRMCITMLEIYIGYLHNIPIMSNYWGYHNSIWNFAILGQVWCGISDTLPANFININTISENTL